MDTIEMLEAIGSNASLRHAPSNDLSVALERANASPALTSAVVTGESAGLMAELGHKLMWMPQVGQFFSDSES